ncbi:MAG: hypothetical protein AAGA53_16055 [Pseudomonadota bacterium]
MISEKRLSFTVNNDGSIGSIGANLQEFTDFLLEESNDKQSGKSIKDLLKDFAGDYDIIVRLDLERKHSNLKGLKLPQAVRTRLLASHHRSSDDTISVECFLIDKFYEENAVHPGENVSVEHSTIATASASDQGYQQKTLAFTWIEALQVTSAIVSILRDFPLILPSWHQFRRWVRTYVERPTPKETLPDPENPDDLSSSDGDDSVGGDF